MLVTILQGPNFRILASISKYAIIEVSVFMALGLTTVELLGLSTGVILLRAHQPFHRLIVPPTYVKLRSFLVLKGIKFIFI
ncbi:hypothetical protein CU633_11260 [Bacillus sp. V3-13]|nr:hypothetical protein CU633_11260 [Bacillus sp. V3-13]